MIEKDKERIRGYVEEELGISGYLKADMDDFCSMEGEPYVIIREKHSGEVEDLARMVASDISGSGVGNILSAMILIRSNGLTMAELSFLDTELHKVLGETVRFRRGIARDGTLATGENSVALILFA